jgi:hypothetical protein
MHVNTMTTIRKCSAPMIIIGIIGLFEDILLIKLYKYEFRTIKGTWKQGSSYFVVKPIKYGFKFFRNSVIFDNIFLCKCKNT